MEERDFPVEFSSSLGELAKALAEAQGEMSNAGKDRTNPHFKHTYATLASVRAAVTPALVKHGLAVAQLNEPHGDAGVCVVTIMMHAGSGEWLRSRLFVPATKKDAQGFGSALTYARRYALGAICGVATENDDDGEAVVTEPPQRAAQQSRPDASAKPNKEAIDKFIASIKLATDAETLAAVGLEVKKAKLSDNDQAVVRLAWAERSKELGT